MVANHGYIRNPESKFKYRKIVEVFIMYQRKTLKLLSHSWSKFLALKTTKSISEKKFVIYNIYRYR